MVTVQCHVGSRCFRGMAWDATLTATSTSRANFATMTLACEAHGIIVIPVKP